jgi:hypothetical protein
MRRSKVGPPIIERLSWPVRPAHWSCGFLVPESRDSFGARFQGVVGRVLMGRRVLVCGGRDFNDSDKLFEVLDEEHARNPFDLVITGGARGADWWGHYWAIKRGVPYKVFPADWINHGKAAAPIRDQQILDDGKPDVVIAFPGGSGTDDVINRAGLAEVPVVKVK